MFEMFRCRRWREGAVIAPALFAALLGWAGWASLSVAEEPVSGLFHWDGDAAPSAAPRSLRRSAAHASAASVAGPQQSELAAMVFFHQRAAALGIEDPAKSLRLRRSDTDRFGATHLRYYRYLEGLRVEDMEIIAHVSASGLVTGVNGYAVPVPSELAAHVARWRDGHLPSIDEARVREQVALDIQQAVDTLEFLSVERVATAELPWLVWVVEARAPADMGHWEYRIKDESGEIIQRRHIVIR